VHPVGCVPVADRRQLNSSLSVNASCGAWQAHLPCRVLPGVPKNARHIGWMPLFIFHTGDLERSDLWPDREEPWSGGTMPGKRTRYKV